MNGNLPRGRARGTLLAAIALMCFSLIAACSGSPAVQGDTAGDGGSPNTQASSPIKVGLIAPQTGPYANIGRDIIIGAKIAVDKINRSGGVGGRKVKLVTKDSQFSPEVASRAMRELASAGVNIVTGFGSSASCLAAAPLAEEFNMVIISSTCSATAISTTDFHPRLFAISANSVMMATAGATIATTALSDVDVWSRLCYDYLTGHEFCDVFKDHVTEEADVTFAKTRFPPLETSRWTPYVTSLASGLSSSRTYGLYVFLFPSDVVSLTKQGKAYGLYDKYKYVFVGATNGQAVASALGPKGPEMQYVYDYFYKAFDNELNRYLVQTYKERHPDSPYHGPSAFTYQAFTAVLAIKAGVEAAGGVSPEQIAKVLPGLHFQSPKGEVHFREDHLLVAPVAAFRCGGSSDDPKGYECSGARPVPAEKVMPPVQIGG